MTEHPTATVARDLAALVRLAMDLPEQAEHAANSRVIMGGDALAEMAPVANLEAWGNRQTAAEQAYYDGRRSAFPETVHEDDGDEPVLQTLRFWTEDLRREWDVELDVPYTIATEAGFLRFHIETIYDNEPRFDDLAADVSRAKRKLENILRAGNRDEATRVRCANPECDRKPLLKRIVTEAGLQSWWKCRACRTRYDAAGFDDARRKQWAEAGEHFLPRGDAMSLLLADGVPDPLVRKWLSSEGLDETDAYLDGRTQMVRWSAVRTQQREREARLAEDRRRRAERRGA